jgi:hypothetical protein
LTVNSGTTPYGTAVFSFKQNGITVAEVGVPPSPPIDRARIFIEYRSNVRALSGRTDSGTVNINTGIAVVNRGSAAANVVYTLRDMSGASLAVGHGTIAASMHFAKFIDQLSEVASDFKLPSDFQSNVHFGSLEISSDIPLSVLALRGTVNQRNEFLMTTTPTADLTQSLSYDSVYFPHFADGGGYTTSLILLNTSNGPQSGILQILDNDGLPLIVNQVGGTADSSFRYSIPAGGAYHFQTDGFPTSTKTGSVRLTPSAYNSTPVGSGVFGYNPEGILVSESGIPATSSTTHARVYVDLSRRHNTGIAVANVQPGAAVITVKAYQSDGMTAIGTSKGPLSLTAGGHDAKFADELISGLPSSFTGVLDISSKTPFAALTLRSLTNERDDFLMTTFPIVDFNKTAPSPILFPQIADGGGYATEVIVISPAEALNATLRFYGEDGAALDLSK